MSGSEDAGFVELKEDMLFFRPAELEDLARINENEQAGFPEDEAATPENMKFRIENAGDFFLVGCLGESVVAHMCGTLSRGERLSHASMSAHDPEGDLLCIHSVCVAPEYWRRGYGRALVKAYIGFMRVTQADRVRALRLLCKKELIPFYESGGFSLLGPSTVVHGQDPWFELTVELREQAP